MAGPESDRNDDEVKGLLDGLKGRDKTESRSLSNDDAYEFGKTLRGAVRGENDDVGTQSDDLAVRQVLAEMLAAEDSDKPVRPRHLWGMSLAATIVLSVMLGFWMSQGRTGILAESGTVLVELGAPIRPLQLNNPKAVGWRLVKLIETTEIPFRFERTARHRYFFQATVHSVDEWRKLMRLVESAPTRNDDQDWTLVRERMQTRSIEISEWFDASDAPNSIQLPLQRVD